MCVKTSWEKKRIDAVLFVSMWVQLKSFQTIPSQMACGARRGLWPPTHPSSEQPGASWDLPCMSCGWGGEFSLLCRTAKGIYLGWLNPALKSTGWPQEKRLERQAGEPGGHGEFMTLVFLRGCARNCTPEPDTEFLLSFSPVKRKSKVVNHYWVSLQFPCQTKCWTIWHSWWVSVVHSILNSLHFSFFFSDKNNIETVLWNLGLSWQQLCG